MFNLRSEIGFVRPRQAGRRVFPVRRWGIKVPDMDLQTGVQRKNVRLGRLRASAELQTGVCKLFLAKCVYPPVTTCATVIERTQRGSGNL